ncbi:histidine kinase [Agromyces sp. H66]|uniref:sensor histidine kinase n=1 Tax=Agromyces sp. H66 TaxID=2529859 RepID=UPI0010AACBAA|nr:histidine kinase [Agromyces sp. H66]
MTESQLAPDPADAVVGGELRLPKPPGVVRQFWARHPRLVDGLIAGIYGVPTLVNTIVSAIEYQHPTLIAIVNVAVVLTASAAIMLMRRTHTWVVLGLAWLACLVSATAVSIDTFAIVLALYALAVYGSSRAAWIGLGASVAVATFAGYLSTWVRSTPPFEPADLDPISSSIAFAVFMLIATLIGVTVGNRRRYLDALIARAHDLARERDQERQLAAAAERARIAREMHDIVSHGLTVMITLAEGSAATVEHDPARSAEAMRRVADAGRDALSEMRRMLGVLNDASGDAATRSPQPDAAAIPDLVEGFREAGLPVRLTTAGAPITGTALQLAAYRIVQEGLTNVLRHADGAQHVEVLLDHRDDAVEITIEDDAVHASGRMSGAGRGLEGLRERVALSGGTLEAGPRAGNGWRLHAVLPTEPSDPREDP